MTKKEKDLAEKYRSWAKANEETYDLNANDDEEVLGFLGECYEGLCNSSNLDNNEHQFIYAYEQVYPQS